MSNFKWETPSIYEEINEVLKWMQLKFFTSGNNEVTNKILTYTIKIIHICSGINFAEKTVKLPKKQSFKF